MFVGYLSRFVDSVGSMLDPLDLRRMSQQPKLTRLHFTQVSRSQPWINIESLKEIIRKVAPIICTIARANSTFFKRKFYYFFIQFFSLIQLIGAREAHSRLLNNHDNFGDPILVERIVSRLKSVPNTKLISPSSIFLQILSVFTFFVRKLGR